MDSNTIAMVDSSQLGNCLKHFFPFAGLRYLPLRDWFNKAYTNVTEIKEKEFLCQPLYFVIYLTWTNFAVKFVIPTLLLIGCNIKILFEVSIYDVW